MTRERLTCRRVEVLLEAYLDGDLAAPRAAQMETHLARCFNCAQELQHARRVRDALRALPERFCPGELVERLQQGVQAGERAPASEAAAAPGWRDRLAAWTARAWRPALAAAALAVVVVLGVTRLVVRPPSEQQVTAADVARAETQVRWLMARLGDINRRTGVKVRDDVLQARVVAPSARAVEDVLGTTTQ